jgi:hypothetical protein
VLVWHQLEANVAVVDGKTGIKRFDGDFLARRCR